MKRFIIVFVAFYALLLPLAAQAESADIDAAARGVVRVVIIGNDGGELYPVSHGTGFAVAPNVIATNAHVVRDAVNDKGLRIGIVPSSGNQAVYGKIIAISTRNDLALIRLTGGLRLPPLALAAGPVADAGEVTSVGYPMNVDRAQGLDIADLFRSQPPVKSRGFVSGQRPSRQFDTILHTAPIARGNSGGPLLDLCGRVLGVNSFGADSEDGDAEFFFAVSNNELIPFLRANDISPRLNDMPCRSLADLEEAERDRIEREQMAARQKLTERAEETRAQRDRAQLQAQLSVAADRESRMALAFILVLIACGIALWAWNQRKRINPEADDAAQQLKKANIAFAAAGFLLVVGFIAFVTRPGLDEIDRRVAEYMAENAGAEKNKNEPSPGRREGGNLALTCYLLPERSRVTSADISDVELNWTSDGCVNGRTQYGYASGNWSRIFVPNEEDAVAVNSFDPDRRIFRSERYLLGRDAMTEARTARSKYTAPECNIQGAAVRLGDVQGEVLSQLPLQPNERLVYACEPKE